ncbi:MAG: hypothetical protein J1E60_08430 [Christensenellaceae bacterium]|nr:hypothetical protein [Christensenellaceae bacterium]
MKKKLAFLAIFVVLGVAAFAQQTVQVRMPESVNLPRDETVWLPGQIQDKLKSNLQEYLGLRTVADSASEAIVKQLQRESEDSGRDESEAIPAGKLRTAKFAVLARIRKTGKGYTISVDYTDIKTAEQLATATSKEYKSAEALYENTGAIDEITLALADQLNIAINPIQKQALEHGTADFSIDDQLALARQNEEQYKRMMDQFDEELRALAVSNDLNAVENTKKIEAEKALLAEKQQSEQRRLAELAEQKKQAAEDAKNEAIRSDELKRKRDSLSAEAEAKAAEVRKLKMERQGVFGQINVIERKKRALVEIRQGVEARIQELSAQTEKDKADEKQRISSREYRLGETDGGVPTEKAQQDRRNEISVALFQLDEKFEKEAKEVRARVAKQDEELLKEIRNDQQKIKGVRTVSSLGDELKVSYGAYSGTNKIWKAYFSLYSDGILLHQGDFELEYRAVSGKQPVTDKSSKEYDEYMDNVDIYNTLLLRGVPILYYEIDYTVNAAPDNEPSKYTFTFQRLRVKDTSTGKTVQEVSLHQSVARTMQPVCDIRTAEDIAAYIQAQWAEISAQKERMEAQKGFYHELGGGGLGGLGVDFTYIALDSDYKLMGVNVYLDIALRSWMFLDFGIGGSATTSDNTQDVGFFNIYGGIGVNRRIHIFKWHPAVYYLFDIGGIISTEERKEWERKDIYIGNQFFLKQSVGGVLPLAGAGGNGAYSFDLIGCYSLMLFPGIPKFADSFSVGIRWTFHFN